MDETLHSRFLRGLAGSGRATAAVISGRAFTYDELHERALAWAGQLLKASDEPPRAVAVLADKSIQAYAGVLAALYAGAAVVPLHPGFPPARTRAMLLAAGASALIADPASAAQLPRLLEGLPRIAVAVPEADELGGPALSEPRTAEAGQTAYLVFTSGSTGRPKGVRISHGNLAHYFSVLDGQYDFQPDDRFSQTFGLTWDATRLASAVPIPLPMST